MNFIFALFFPLLSASTPVEIPKSEFSVYIFVSETCPICQYYSKKLNKIQKDYESYKIILVYPNKLSSDQSVGKFQKKYNLEFDYILDPKLEWVNKFDAEITPEVFVYHEKQDSVYYRGRIDDNYYRVGKRRANIKSDDLNLVLESLQKKEKIETPITKAIGCFISKY